MTLRILSKLQSRGTAFGHGSHTQLYSACTLSHSLLTPVASGESKQLTNAWSYFRHTVRLILKCLSSYLTIPPLTAPAHEAVKYQTVRFNGTLNFPSPYSGAPTPELDAAWDRITTNNSCECSSSISANKLLNRSLKCGQSASQTMYSRR